MKKIKFLSLVFLLVTFSCSEKDEPFVIETLVSSDSFLERGKNELISLMDLAGFGELESYIQYDINVYKITYKTNYLGQEIIASGLVSFPDTKEAIPMLSFHNGTETKKANAPTLNSNFTLLSSIAGAGYIFVVPDYIGFGSSASSFHPYYVKDLMASSIVDMLKAARELAHQEGYNFNGDVYLSGYSEGGYATMATHKEMEENPVTGLNLKASAPSSGGYDVKGMQEYFVSLETYPQPYYLAYVALSYKNVYGWSDPMSTFFQEPYATNLSGYFDGSKSGSEINGFLTDAVADYLQPEFQLNADTDPTFAKIIDAFEENSLDEWVPGKTMYMYHGNADTWVPYQNSVDTYDNFMRLGASPNTVTFTTIEGATHSSGFGPYLIDAVKKFDALK